MVNSRGPGPVSMTGYAARRGQGEGCIWVWDLRAVNGKGLDLRLRLPDWIEGLEPVLRAELAKVVTRGNVTVGLKVERVAAGGELRLNAAGLAAALAALKQVEQSAFDADLALAAPTLADVLAIRGVAETSAAEVESSTLVSALASDFEHLLGEFDAVRRREGAALGVVIGGQIDRVADLVSAAEATAEARRPQARVALETALARVMAGVAEFDPGRIAQELALLAVKADVTEEIDRLRAHVEAARALLTGGGAIGRKFDFLMQEFMREANTLCSKSGNPALTAIGLDLKVVIDQMREQVQNLE